MTAVQLFLACLVAGIAIPAEPSRPAAPAYRVIGTIRTSTLEKEVNEAARNGYRVVFGAKTNNASKMVILRASLDGPYQYRVISTESYSGTDTEELPAELNALEKKLNAAAAAGFHLVPQAFFPVPDLDETHGGGSLVAVMEKAVLSANTEYRLMAVTTVYELTPLSLNEGGTPRLETEDADGKLAGAVRAGYRVVALVARGSQSRARRGRSILNRFRLSLAREVVVVLEKAGQPVSNSREALGRYHLAVEKESELDTMLNGAAAAGYHLLAVAHEGYPVIAAIFERNAPDEPRMAYTHLRPGNIGPFTYRMPDVDAIAGSLSTAARSGWLPHAHGIIGAAYGPYLGYALFVVEKIGRAAEASKPFLVLNEARGPRLEDGLNSAAAEGYEFKTAGILQRRILAVLTRAN